MKYTPKLKPFYIVLMALFAIGLQQESVAEDSGKYPFGDRSIFSDRATEQRIKPMGQVCMKGEGCAGENVKLSGAVTKTEPRSPEQIYNASCMGCHAAGVAGAPKMGDEAAWTARLEKGLDNVINNAIKGVNAMPAMGMCMDCSEDDIKEVVHYMLGDSK